jgi:hypothetical protein
MLIPVFSNNNGFRILQYHPNIIQNFRLNNIENRYILPL